MISDYRKLLFRIAAAICKYYVSNLGRLRKARIGISIKIVRNIEKLDSELVVVSEDEKSIFKLNS